MYDAIADPYCYPGSTVLKNLPGLQTQDELDAFEAASTMQRSEEPLPNGRLSVSHYQAVHRHLFQDVYPWAGQFRAVRMSKDGSAFCYPEHIRREMKAVFAGLKAKAYLANAPPDRFVVEAAEFLSTLNAIHPFREGNGRTQTIFLAMLADRAGYPLNLGRLDPTAFLAAMVRSFQGKADTLVAALTELIQQD